MQALSKSQKGLLIALFALLGLLLLFWQSSYQISLKDQEGKLLQVIPLQEKDYFEIEFRHSVNRGLVQERYEIDRAACSIYLSTGWFENYGAGMMDTLGEGMVMTEDGDSLKIDFPKQEMTSVTYRSAGIANHTMTYGDTTIHFFENWPYQSITISIEKTNLLHRIR